MAVFPDRIVLKNSTDDEATIVAAIETGGTDAITQGEIVLGLSNGAAALFTKDALGAIVAISGSGGSGGEGCCGRGDGGDFDLGSVDSGFVFGIYGGGDFSSTTEDLPIELVASAADGGEFTI